LSINCKIVDLCLINPNSYRILYIENDIRKADNNTIKYETSALSKEQTNEGTNHRKFISSDMTNKKRSLLKNQILKETQEANLVSPGNNHNNSMKSTHNNYINITEDYKYDFQKMLQNDSKNLSVSQINLNNH